MDKVEKRKSVEIKIDSYTVHVTLSICLDRDSDEIVVDIADSYATYPVPIRRKANAPTVQEFISRSLPLEKVPVI